MINTDLQSLLSRLLFAVGVVGFAIGSWLMIIRTLAAVVFLIILLFIVTIPWMIALFSHDNHPPPT